MKIVINVRFGGFSIKNSIAKKYGFDEREERRDNEKLIKLIEEGVDCNGSSAELEVIEIPDESTDYCIIEHDGAEDVAYVVNGRIKWFFS